MVDFNNEGTIGTPATDVEKISILQRRYDLIEAVEDYKKKRLSGAGVPLSIIRARLLSLFIEIQAMLRRRLEPEEFEKIKKGCLKADTEDRLLEVIFNINEELDKVEITRIDTKQK